MTSASRYAIIETVFAGLIDGPLAHQPSGRKVRLNPTTWNSWAAGQHAHVVPAG